MAQVVVMPQMGNTVESCLLSAWQVEVGSVVDANSSLCDIETDKSAMDVPAGVAGTVLALLVEEGDEVPVKSPIAVIGETGENVEAILAEAGIAPQVTGEAGEVEADREDELTPAATDPTPETPAPSTPAPVVPTATADSTEAAGSSPRARARAEREGVPLSAVAGGTGPDGRVIERDVIAAIAAGPRPTAGTRGADLTGFDAGTGLGGRVTREDLTAAANQPVPTARAVGDREFPGEYIDTSLKGIRKLVADRMRNALAVSAQLSYDSSAAAAPMMSLRGRFKASDPALGYTGITLGDLICFATVQVLRRHPNLNAHLDDGVLRTFTSVHLGLAVDTPRGLLVPTIRNADAMTLRELSDTTKELADAARSGRIDPELLTGATFTVSNLGSFGIESFTPIVNVPQTGILGVNTILPRPVLLPDGGVGMENRMGFSLTADHQVVDGADAGRFLADLVVAIENIDLTVLG